jgi:hypothetical protein
LAYSLDDSLSSNCGLADQFTAALTGTPFPVRKDAKTLHAACLEGHTETVRSLLEVGSDLNLRDKNSWTPLHVAASSGNLAICELLMSQQVTIPSP